ncbi:MAG: TIGR00725 family protein [Dehalococcoidia bacterium]|nr:TIGR00725 family protein [Dehalococcoidia bacterium]
MSGNSRLIIAVIGGSQCNADEARMAEKVGRGLAKRGAVVVCGGLSGVMEAACRGAQAEGGLTIGILPGDSRHSANPYVQLPIVTGMGYARNVIVVKSAQAVIAIGGSYGTLSEIAHALQSGIPVIGLNTWSCAREESPDKLVIPATDPEDAVNKAISLAIG